MNDTIYDRLRQLRDSSFYPFHMPGHKRNTGLFCMENPYGLDITEIEGFDNLHDAKGLIRDAMDRAAKIYGSGETHFLINGSTSGILSGIMGAVRERDRILMMRNCHKSVYHAVVLNHLDARYLYPASIEKYGICAGITAEEVKEAIDRMEGLPELIILVSPTYEGILSDVEGIVTLAHSMGIPVLVDEAHGAHFGFHPDFPVRALQHGADIVIQSLHKTMPCFTQTALIHMQGNLVDRERIRRYLSMLQTSSPSYLLMASMDQCMELLEKEGETLFCDYASRLSGFYREAEELRSLRVLGVKEKEYNQPSVRDRSKILINTGSTKLNGHQLNDILRNRYHLEMEMVCEKQVLAMTSIGDTEEGLRRLLDALKEIDRASEENTEAGADDELSSFCRTERKVHIWEAVEEKVHWVFLEEAEGKTAGDYVYPYPPGIPLVVPGEIIDEAVLCRIKKMVKAKLDVKGIRVQEDKILLPVLDI